MEKKEKDILGQDPREGLDGHLDEHLEQMPAQELPTDIPAEVREKLARDLNDKEAAEDLRQDVRDAEKEEAKEAPPAPTKLTKSRLQELLVKKQDRESTRLNSSHVSISYAVFSLNTKISTTACEAMKQNLHI